MTPEVGFLLCSILLQSFLHSSTGCTGWGWCDNVDFRYQRSRMIRVPEYPKSKYSANTCCTWVIKIPKQSYVDVEVQRFRTFDAFDSLLMMDGSTPLVRLTGSPSLSGNWSHFQLRKSTSSITFQSDGNGVDAGFQLLLKLVGDVETNANALTWSRNRSFVGITTATVSLPIANKNVNKTDDVDKRMNVNKSKIETLKYKLELRNVKDLSWTRIEGAVGGNVNDTATFVLTNLQPASIYEYRLVTVKPNGQQSNVGQAKTLKTKPPAYENNSSENWYFAHESDYFTMEIFVRIDAIGASHYELEYQLEDDGIRPIIQRPFGWNVSVAHFRLAGLLPGLRYSVRPIPWFLGEKGEAAETKTLETADIDGIELFNVSGNSATVWIKLNDSYTTHWLIYRTVNGSNWYRWPTRGGELEMQGKRYVIFQVSGLRYDETYEFMYHASSETASHQSRLRTIETGPDRKAIVATSKHLLILLPCLLAITVSLFGLLFYCLFCRRTRTPSLPLPPLPRPNAPAESGKTRDPDQLFGNIRMSHPANQFPSNKSKTFKVNSTRV